MTLYKNIHKYTTYEQQQSHSRYWDYQSSLESEAERGGKKEGIKHRNWCRSLQFVQPEQINLSNFVFSGSSLQLLAFP